MIINPENVTNCYGSNYPEEFKPVVAGRVKKRLGNAAGLENFGVNLVELAPGSASALRHWHDKQDEFIYVVSGEITLLTDAGEEIFKVGDCAGFAAGVANGHCLINRSGEKATYLEIGDRTSSDRVTYPDDDLVAQNSPEGWIFTHNDGKLY
ncbi:cupin domain-containing protein [Chlorogloea sp. CCALA 695]|uniref:cupin domain-containing protein n=1 Tax=Chlorogloea sp. CCALA 695 TaxID=2107693 RepID=UPI000D06D9DB|nr:cupin domain-containing protein [Chlorogloea sp. CCALA 695]PSB32912.1 cupin [Chlorogloea sp. CCALA 695]